MVVKYTRITIIKTARPDNNNNINELLMWFSGSMGLFNLRDKDRSCFRVFLMLVRDLKQAKKGLSSDEIAEKTNLTRGTAVYHLNKLMESGIVSEQGNKYSLKVNSLKELVDSVRKEADNAFDSMREIAEDIDKQLDLNDKNF